MTDYLFTIDDKYRLEDFGLNIEEGQKNPSIPEIDHKTIHIPERAGFWYFGSEIGERLFSFPLVIKGNCRDEMQQRIDAFKKIILDASGQPRELKLVFDYEPDKFYKVRLINQITPDMIKPFTRFELQLVAYDPHKYASANEYDPKENYLYDRDYMYDIGLMYDNPKSFDWICEKHYSGINNYSSLVADFVIEIQGTVTDPSVTNLNDGTKLTLPSISNGRLLIDGKTYSVTRNGQDVLEGSNYDFFNIQPGEVGFLFEGEKPSATVTYKWMHKFM